MSGQTSAIKVSAGTTPGNFATDRLKTLIERIERLEEEKAALAEDVRDVFAEAKSAGFDVKVIRQIIRLRKIDSNDRAEQEELLDLYKAALGMI
jgi:uncharacterized protein (UPF0335 family)